MSAVLYLAGSFGWKSLWDTYILQGDRKILKSPLNFFNVSYRQLQKSFSHCNSFIVLGIPQRFSTKRTFKTTHIGLIKVDLEFSFSIPGLFQTWNSNKPEFEKLDSRSEPGFEKLNSRSELELSKKTIINWEKSSKPGFDCWVL